MTRSQDKRPEVHLTKYLLGLKSSKQIKAELDAAYILPNTPPPKSPPPPSTKSSLADTTKGNTIANTNATKGTHVVDPKDSTTATAGTTTSSETQTGNTSATSNVTTTTTTIPGTASNFTPEQDAIILKLKGEGKIWKDIGAAVGRSKSEVTARYKELNNTQGGTSSSAATGVNQNGEHNPVKADAKDGKIVTVAADNKFSGDELATLTRLLYEDQEGIWDRVAGKFYDQAGKYFLPEDIKKKLGFGG